MNRFSQFIPSEYVPLDTNLLLKAGMYAEQNALEDLNKINNAIGTLNAIPAKYSQDSEYLKSRLDQTKNNISGLISNTSEFTQPDFVGKINQEVNNFTNDPNIRQILNDNQHWDDVQKSRVKNPNSTYDQVLSTDIEKTKKTYDNTGTLTDMTQIPYSTKHYNANEQFVKAINALKNNKLKTDDGYTVTEIITNAYIKGNSIDPTRITNALNLVLNNDPELNKSLELNYRANNGLGFLDSVDLNELNKYKQETVLGYATTYLNLETSQELGDLSKYSAKLSMKGARENNYEEESELVYETKDENNNLIDDSDAENELMADDTLPSFTWLSETILEGTNLVIEGVNNMFGTNISTSSKPDQSEHKFKKVMSKSNLKNLNTEGQISVYTTALKNTRNSGSPLLTINITKKGKTFDYFNQKDISDMVLNNVIVQKRAIRDENQKVLTPSDTVDYPTDIKDNFIFAGYDPIKGLLKYTHQGNNKNYYVEPPQSFMAANGIIKEINNSRFRIGNKFINIGDGKQVMTSTDILTNDITNPNATLNTVIFDKVYSKSEFNNLENKETLLYKVFDSKGEELENIDYNKAPDNAKIVVTRDQTKGTDIILGIGIDDYNEKLFKNYYKQLIKK